MHWFWLQLNWTLNGMDRENRLMKGKRMRDTFISRRSGSDKFRPERSVVTWWIPKWPPPDGTNHVLLLLLLCLLLLFSFSHGYEKKMGIKYQKKEEETYIYTFNWIKSRIVIKSDQYIQQLTNKTFIIKLNYKIAI